METTTTKVVTRRLLIAQPNKITENILLQFERYDHALHCIQKAMNGRRMDTIDATHYTMSQH